MTQPTTGHGWRQWREWQKPAKPRTHTPRQDGCHCDTGPVIAATWRNTNLTVAIEHWEYCPLPNIDLDPNAYADTGQRIPIGDTP
jgi:hypothetical protein